METDFTPGRRTARSRMQGPLSPSDAVIHNRRAVRPSTSGPPIASTDPASLGRAGRSLRWIIVIAAVVAVTGSGALRAGVADGQLPGMQNRNPFREAESASPKLDPKVRWVKLDSCATHNLAKPRPGGLSDTEAEASENLTRYHAMLAAYAASDSARSTSALLSWSDQRLARTLSFVNRRGVDPHSPWEPRVYGLAVMMHTDLALQIANGEAVGDLYLQFQVAADLLQLGLTCAPDSVRPLAPLWYVTLSRYLRDRNAFDVSARLLELARARLKDDASVFTESGLLAESIGTLFALSPPTGTSWRTPDAGLIRMYASRRRSSLENAAAWFGQAAAIEPDNGEILLHLGRVQALRLDDARALRTLGSSIEKASSYEGAYLAASFIAAVYDRQGRLDEATAAYRKAIERYPNGHAARVGLAEVLRRSGRIDESRTILRELVSAADRVDEPFWWYLLEPPGVADARLEALRAEVRR